MKNLDKEAIKKAADEGRIDKKAVFSLEKKKPALDDREPMDRMADELKRFTAAVQGMTQIQAKEMASLLQTILGVVERIASVERMALTERKVEVPERRPLAWSVKVIGRDSAGMIEDVQLTANEKNNTLN